MKDRLGLGGLDSSGVSSGLLQSHDLESLKVGEGGPGLSGGEPLGPGRGIPLGLDTALLPELGDGGRAGRSRQTWDDVWGEGEVGVRLDVSGDSGRWSIDERSVVVDNLSDESELPSVRSDVQVDDSADLDKSLESLVLDSWSVRCATAWLRLLHRWYVTIRPRKSNRMGSSSPQWRTSSLRPRDCHVHRCCDRPVSRPRRNGDCMSTPKLDWQKLSYLGVWCGHDCWLIDM